MSAELTRHVNALDQRMRNQEAQENPLFTTTATGNATPVADSNGAIGIGWLQVKQSIGASESITIYSGYGLVVTGDFTVDGDLIVDGDMAFI